MNKKNTNGFTLLEVVLVMTISGIIVLTIGLTYMSSYNAFSGGEDLIQVQQDIRLAIRHLTKEIRNAEEIKLYDSVPESPGNYSYIYLDNNSFKIKTESVEKTVYSGNITLLNFNIVPVSEEDSDYDYYIKFSITGNQGNSTYQISSTKILLNNLDTNTSDNNNGTVIAYKNPT